MNLLSRRSFLAASAGAVVAPCLLAADPPGGRPRVAAVYTVFRHRSHAQNILENFLQPYLFNGRVVDPGVDVVSFYADQRVPEGDRTDEVARRFGVPVHKTIRDALTLGGKALACDAVLLIGEHGEYPVNELGQIEYPRKRFFDEAVAVMRESGRFVSVFNDKHLSYRWDWSKEMYDTARRHRIPLIAGSSVPLGQRVPPLELPAEPEVEEVVSVHGGSREGYDFHAFEVLQSLIERRKGGETGISSVELLAGDAVWKAGDAGRWPVALARAAMAAELGDKAGDLRRPIGREPAEDPHVLLITYKDGLRATVLKLGRNSNRWNVALKLKGEAAPRGVRIFNGPWGNRNLFMALSHAIQNFFRTGEPPYPVERTLLASGVVDAAMHSAAAGKPVPTPHLEFRYAAKDFRAFRETGESWKIVEKRVEDKHLHTLGKK
ncbi:MAG TPA: hypothetical protein VKE74_22070 [Gemmataceae bacterium]|nr:hypothetical protein [Gemmataceae bacterium]